MINETLSNNRAVNVEVSLRPLPISSRIRATVQNVMAWMRRSFFSAL